jgi:hypothetical protein
VNAELVALFQKTFVFDSPDSSAWSTVGFSNIIVE